MSEYGGVPRRNIILKEAEEVINGARREQYGDAGTSFGMIADLWSAYLGPLVTLTPEDVAMMMILLKISRQSSGAGDMDNWIDICGYAALGGELSKEADK